VTVLLVAPYEFAVERVAAEPDGQLSKYPSALRRSCERAESLLSTFPPSDSAFDSAAIFLSAIADAVGAAIQRAHQ
jgi:hypothetical protein